MHKRWPASSLVAMTCGLAGALAVAQTWSPLAAEGESFSVGGTKLVRYGVGAAWVSKSVSGSGQCSNAFFGSDPAYMKAKSCEVEGGPASVSAAIAGTATNSAAPEPTAPATMDFALISNKGGTMLPFTLGQALRQGDVPAGNVLIADLPSFQAIVKNRWPDGSAKFAVLSGRADLVANRWRKVRLTAGTAAPSHAALSVADLKATGVSASVDFSPFGSASWSANDWDKPVQSWISGSEMSSFVYRKPIGGDAHLVAWLEVRTYREGRTEVLPWIENGFLNVPGPTEKFGFATFKLSGTPRFSAPLTLLNHQRAVLASGAALTHWAGSDPQVTPRLNTSYLMATRLVPHYSAKTGAGSPLFARLPTSYEPLAQASFSPDMPKPGYEPGIGLLPEWDAAYLSSGGDPRAHQAVLVNGYAAGRYGIHYRDETTQRPILFARYPNLVMAREGSGVSQVSESSTGARTPSNSGPPPPTYDSPHHPSMGYTAYLLTGWQYFLEESQFLATANHLKNNNTTRQGAKGIMETSAGANTTRGAAWAIRSLAQAAAITPDADTALHKQFVSSIDENITYYHGRYITIANNPLGLVQPYSDYNPGDPWESASWMDDFFTATFGYLKDMWVYSPSLQPQLDAFLRWKYVSVVGRLGTGVEGTFNYRYAAPYTLNYAPSANSKFDTGTGPWYPNWGAVAASMGIAAADGGTSLQGRSGSDPSNMHEGFWGNMFPALAYAVDHGAPGAEAAYARLTAASNFASNAAKLNDAPVWSVMPRSR